MRYLQISRAQCLCGLQEVVAIIAKDKLIILDNISIGIVCVDIKMYIYRMEYNGITWYQYGDTNYYVNKLGQLLTTNWKNSGQIRIMKPSISNGYYKTSITIDGKVKSIRIHRLIAEIFIPNPNNKPTVNHKNGIKSDNRASNLEWATHSEQMIHATRIGLNKAIGGWNKNKECPALQGENNGSSKLTKREVLEIRDKYKPRLYTRKKLAEEYNVSEHCIKDILSRKSWKHI